MDEEPRRPAGRPKGDAAAKRDWQLDVPINPAERALLQRAADATARPLRQWARLALVEVAARDVAGTPLPVPISAPSMAPGAPETPGARIRRLREAKGWSPTDLTVRVWRNPAQVRKLEALEAGEQLPTPTDLAILERVLA